MLLSEHELNMNVWYLSPYIRTSYHVVFGVEVGVRCLERQPRSPFIDRLIRGNRLIEERRKLMTMPAYGGIAAAVTSCACRESLPK